MYKRRGLWHGILWTWVVIFITGCGPSPNPPVQGKPSKPLEAPLFSLSADEKVWVQTLGTSIPVGMLYQNGFPEPGEGPKLQGFHYQLAQEFAKFLGVKFEYRSVELGDLDRVSPPGVLRVFQSVRFIAGGLTLTPQRLQFFDGVPVLPVKILLVHHRDFPWDWQGRGPRSLGVRSGSVHETWLKALVKSQGKPWEVRPFDSEEELLGALQNRRIHGGLLDSDTALTQVPKFSNLALGYPVSEVQYLGWAFPEPEDPLAGIFQRWLASQKSQGLFDQIFHTSMGMGPLDYFHLLDIPPQGNLGALNPGERSLLRKIFLAGGLNAAIDEEQGYYQAPGFSRTLGFHHLFLRSFAASLGVPLKERVVEFQKIFLVEGKIPGDPDKMPPFSYRPDILKTSALVVAPITDRPWRRNLFHLVPVVPNRMVLLGLKGRKVQKLEDLNGKTLAVWPNSTYWDQLETLKKTQGLVFETQTLNSSEDGFSQLLARKADFLTLDAFMAIPSLGRFPQLDVVYALGSQEELAWALDPEIPELKTLFERFLLESKKQGIFSQLWNQTFPVGFPLYLDMLSMGDKQ